MSGEARKGKIRGGGGRGRREESRSIKTQYLI